MAEPNLAATRWNRLEDRITKAAFERMKWIEEQLLIDGFPPFYDPMSPREQYQTLVALRNANAPEYWNSPEAMSRLVELAKRFGPPPAPAAPIPGFPVPAPLSPLPAAGP